MQNKQKIWPLPLLSNLSIHECIEQILLNCCDIDRTMLHAKRDIKIKSMVMPVNVYHLIGKLKI